MQITFNLEDAKVYIPSGRLMNLKQTLNWEEIELTSSDEYYIKNYINGINFKINADFSKRLATNVKNFMQQYSYDNLRTEMYRNITQRTMIYDVFIEENLSIENIPQQLVQNIVDKLEENSDILSKKRKLAQLQLVNSMS